MKYLVSAIIGLTLFTSCGRVESPSELVDFLDNKKTVDSNKDRISELEKRLDQYYVSLEGLEANIDKVGVDQDTLTLLVNNNVSSIATIETNNTVSEMIDPCGDNPNEFDEILLIMSDGSIIAYFEQGSKRFLGELPDGNYRTTDRQACNFSVVNGVYQE